MEIEKDKLIWVKDLNKNSWNAVYKTILEKEKLKEDMYLRKETGLWKRISSKEYDIFQAFYAEDFFFTLEVKRSECQFRFWMEKEGFLKDFYLTRYLQRFSSKKNIYSNYQDVLYQMILDLEPYLDQVVYPIPNSFSTDSKNTIQLFALPATTGLLDLYQHLERLKI